jgi:hypothetical protein
MKSRARGPMLLVHFRDQAAFQISLTEGRLRANLSLFSGFCVRQFHRNPVIRVGERRQAEVRQKTT